MRQPSLFNLSNQIDPSTLGSIGIETSPDKIGDALPTTDLYNGRKFIVKNDGTYYYDAREEVWIKAQEVTNPYDISFNITSPYTEGSIIGQLGISRNVKLDKTFIYSVATASTASTAVVEVYAGALKLGEITFTASTQGVFSSDMLEDYLIHSGTILRFVGLTGTVDGLAVVLSTSLLGV